MQKKNGMTGIPFFYVHKIGIMQMPLFSALYDLQDALRAGLRADTAGDALRRSFALGSLDHDMHRADFHALAAAGAFLLVDDPDTLLVLGDRLLRAVPCALAAHNAGVRCRLAVLADHDANAGLLRIVNFIESLRACDLTGQAGHT